MTALAHPLCGIRTWFPLLTTAGFAISTNGAIINVQSSQLGAHGNLSYASTFGWGHSSRWSNSPFGPITCDKVRGNGGAGAAYSYGIDWNGPFDVEDQLEVFMPWWESSIAAVGYAVDPAGSSFSSQSEIRSYASPWSLLIEPSEGEMLGTPVLVQIDTHIAGRLSASGSDAIAEAQFSTISDAGPLLDESLSAIDDRIDFDFRRSQTFESAIGEEFTLQFDHSLQVSGEYGTAACAAFAEIWEFQLNATVTAVPEPGSLVTVALLGMASLACRALVRR